MIRLIVNADDFGLTTGVNRAVEELAARGALSSATLMANGAAFAHAATIKGPSVGCHVVLVDGSPLSPASSVQSLLGPDGRLRDSLLQFVADLQRGKIREAEIEAEAAAQIHRVQAAGIQVSHVDTHKHTHLFPRVARPLLRAAVLCGVGAIRNPFEDAWSARLTRGSIVRKLEVAALRSFQRRFHQLRQAAGLQCPDGSIGVSATGSLDAEALQRLLDTAPDGTWELVCHPGYNDTELDAVKTRLRGTRDVERLALMDLIPTAVASGRVKLITFRDL